MKTVSTPITLAELAAMAEAGFGVLDSMINVRPIRGNRTRGVEDAATRERLLAVVAALVER
jgi:hypothetical protein